jgi:hypothetical protein
MPPDELSPEPEWGGVSGLRIVIPHSRPNFKSKLIDRIRDKANPGNFPSITQGKKRLTLAVDFWREAAAGAPVLIRH